MQNQQVVDSKTSQWLRVTQNAYNRKLIDLMEKETKNEKIDEKLIQIDKKKKEFNESIKLITEDRQAIRDRNLKRRKEFDDQKDQIGIQAMLQLKKLEK